ncbi:MAG: molybdopterin molybdotransferase MoeA [Myxococcales bacterium]|nr:molybdopterin molybdotransferase MoeA [Myxococcales bacterium]
MRGFRRREEVATVLARVRARAVARARAIEEVAITRCAGRILAADARAPIDVPGFRRAAVDGFAIRGEDSFGATESAPIELTLIGTSLPGRPCPKALCEGEAVRITTGAPLPAGADAVLQAELARPGRTHGGRARIEAIGAVAPQRHVGERGEDVARGELVLPSGRWLRPADAGVLASLGLARAPVIRRPRLQLLVTGSELVAPGEAPGPSQIVDSNSVVLAGLCERDRGDMLETLRAPDGEDALRPRLDALIAGPADVLVVTGATSVGVEDVMPLLLRERGELLVHGVAMRPSSPTAIGCLADGRLVFLLPGNPVSCLCAYEFFVGPVLRYLGGLPDPWRWPHPRLRLRLGQKLVSKIGRLDFVRVRLEGASGSGAREVVPVATSGASNLSSAVRSDGVVLIPPALEGLPAGAEVEVLLFDEHHARGASLREETATTTTAGATAREPR